MPFIVQEIWTDRPTLRRPAADDEIYVMEKYAHHAVKCSVCRHPYNTFINGEALCPRGYHHATNLLQYIYQKCGKAYSVVDREQGRHTQVEIPSEYLVIHDLLKAIDNGLRIPKRRISAPVVVHNSRTASDNKPEGPEPVQRPTTSTAVIPHRNSRLSSNGVYIYRRGSLYGVDLSRQSSPTSSQRVRTPRSYLR
ncbi:hypothetical protein FQN53_009537 [Emmonsiellopsis sp. PD_33]|nr:hypothetical protein FQN53_009537 [Emmonsiellopsis sp. PD_33]